MPRLSIELSKELDERLDKFLPWGVKQRVVANLIEMLADAVDVNGKQLVGLILNKEFNVITKEVKGEKDLVPLLPKAEQTSSS